MKTKIVVEVIDGVANVIYPDKNVEVLTLDYDVDDIDEMEAERRIKEFLK